MACPSIVEGMSSLGFYKYEHVGERHGQSLMVGGAFD